MQRRVCLTMPRWGGNKQTNKVNDMENDEKKIWNDGGPCHACEVKILPHDLEAKTVLCEEAGWITLCKDCPVYVQCYKCGENVHPDKAMVVGECAGYYDHVCINDEGETYNCDE